MLEQELIDSLNIVCSNLLSVLQETEEILSIEKEKYRQVKGIYNPWPVKKRKSTESLSKPECSCAKSELSKQQSSNEITTSLVDSIPQIVSKTRSLRLNPSKNSVTKFSDAKKSIKNVMSSKQASGTTISTKSSNSKSKTSMSLATSSKSNTRYTPSLLATNKPNIKSTTSMTACNKSHTKSGTSMETSVGKTVSFDDNKLHKPSCALYGSDVNKSIQRKSSYSSLSEAVTAYGVPASLQKTLADYHRFVVEGDKIDTVTMKARNSFLKRLNKQNENSWLKATSEVEKLSKYISASNSIRRKTIESCEMPCIMYKNIDELLAYEQQKTEYYENVLWNKILNGLDNEFLPVLAGADLTEKEKIYVCKMIKTICNFSKCKIPNVPVYRIN